jgi:hypothetical protein
VKTTFMLLVTLALAAPVLAQEPPTLSIRPFVLGTEQSFAASKTFQAAFETSAAPLFGGGVQIVVLDRFVAEIGASRFRKTGQRAFISSGGQTSRLGIPLTATITPLEITGGYRFLFARMPRVRPYAAAGWTRYAYKETSDFAQPGEDVDTQHGGWVANGGVEIRVHPWIAIGADAEYSHVPGILGNAGVSQQAGEKDLGGVAARFKLIVGR